MFWIGRGFRDTILNGKYNNKIFIQDFYSAIFITIGYIPLSLTIAIASGMPPETGIYSAMIGAFITALFGSSIHQISGPTGAFIAVITPIIIQYGYENLLIAQIMAGLILIILGITKCGFVSNYIPFPIIIAFTSGTGFILFIKSLEDLGGFSLLDPNKNTIDKILHFFHVLPEANIYALFIGIMTIMIMKFMMHKKTKYPPIIIALIITSILTYLLNKYFNASISVIGSKYSYIYEGVKYNGIPNHLPKFSVTFLEDIFSLNILNKLSELLIPGLNIAFMAGIQSVLTSTMASSLTGVRCHPNSELISTGMSNLIGAFFSGMPASGALSRAAASIQAKSKTMMTPLIIGVLIIFATLFLSKLISFFPLPAIGGILAFTAINMAQINEFKYIIKLGSKHDIIVLLICFVITIFYNLLFSVAIGMTLSFIFFIHRMSKTAISQIINEHENYKLPSDTIIFKVEGPLFFGSSAIAFELTEFNYIYEFKNFIVDISDVNYVDVSALTAFKTLFAKFENNIQIILCGDQKTISYIINAFPKIKFLYFDNVENYLKSQK